MGQQFDAIYDNGVLRPVEPLDYPEGSRLNLQVTDNANDDTGLKNGVTDESKQAVKQRAALLELRRVLSDLPVSSPSGSAASADHDFYLYGKS